MDEFPSYLRPQDHWSIEDDLIGLPNELILVVGVPWKVHSINGYWQSHIAMGPIHHLHRCIFAFDLFGDDHYVDAPLPDSGAHYIHYPDLIGRLRWREDDLK